MQRITSSSYTVGAGEEVTVEILAFETGNTATFVIDTASERVSENPITYEFKVTVGPNATHFAEVRCAFHGPPPDNPQSDPRFEVFLTGSHGGGRAKGPVIRRRHSDHMRDLTFMRNGPPVD